jgi:hypothetical protein
VDPPIRLKRTMRRQRAAIEAAANCRNRSCNAFALEWQYLDVFTLPTYKRAGRWPRGL